MITSTRNPKIQLVRTLQSRARSRQKEDAFIAEGVRLVEEAARANWPAQLLIHTADLSQRGLDTIAHYRALGTEIYEVAPHVMQAASDTQTPQGLLAVLNLPVNQPPEPQSFTLILDQVRDPGNLGAILRTARAAEVDAVLLSPGTADAFSPKVVRAAMGAHFHLAICPLTWNELRAYLNRPVQQTHPQVFLAAAREGIPYTKAPLRLPLALIIGGEAEGVSGYARDLAQASIHIPLPNGSESLNVAVATGILLFEILRQKNQ